jgi:RNA polymerase sigma factor (sigma-70 family)
MTQHDASARAGHAGHQRLRGARHQRVWHCCNDIGALLAAAAEGDQAAWEVLVARFDRTIRATARRHRLGAADQDEVVQHVWVRLVRHIAAIRDPAALGSWLTTAARHESLRLLTRCRDIPVDDVAMDAADDAASPEDDAIAAERRAALRGALDRLPDRQRSLMRMLLTAPAMNYDELSAALGMPKGSIGPTRQRSLARLAHDRQLAGAIGHARPHACRHPADATRDTTGDDTR